MEWMILPLRRYAQFSGRSRRMEYWMYFLFVLIGAVVAELADIALGFAHWESVTWATGYYGAVQSHGPIGAIWLLLNFIPGLAVGARRLHDIDQSAWWLLLCFLPFVGGIVLLVLFCLHGTRGPNRFGPDPLGRLDDLHDTYH